MARHILESTHATIGNTIDQHGVIIEFNDASPVRFSTYVKAPNGSIRWRNIHDTLGDAISARDAKVADRREAMTHALQLATA